MISSQPLEKIRAFVAIPLPEACVRELEALQQHLREQLPDAAGRAARWVRPRQMHLTLKFLGDVEAMRIDQVAVALRSACDGHRIFQLSLDGTGCFPNCRKPRVLWAGVGEQTEALLNLQTSVEKALAPFAEKQEDKAFRPHLTLARIQTRDARHAQQIGEIVEQSTFAISSRWQVERVLLIQSTLRPGGSEYSELAAVELKRAGPL